MRRSLLALACVLVGAAGASPEGPLDRCTVIVTGHDGRERASGLATCLRRVLAKVGADPALEDAAAVTQAVPDAAALAEDIAYFDRMGGDPEHDEQGSRDRPYDLQVHFDPARIDAALAALGRPAWRTGRPVLLAVVGITERNGLHYRLSADGEHGEQQREALFDAADRYGLRVMLPTEEEDPGQAAARLHAARVVALSGTLAWSDAQAGWVGTWTLPGGQAWSLGGVSYDAAFRDAVGGALRRLAPKL